EEALRVGADQRLLCTERLGQPDGEVSGAVMMVVEHREDLALACEPRRLAVRDLLVGVGKRHADPPQPPDDPISRGASATRTVRCSALLSFLGPHQAPVKWVPGAMGWARSRDSRARPATCPLCRAPCARRRQGARSQAPG